TNRVNAVSTPVIAARPNPTNSTDSFNTACPSDTAVSPNFRIDGKSSFVDPSKYPDDPDMPELEDVVYLDDEEDVGAEADLSNLETNISVSPIPITKVHKDHPVTQIIEPKKVHQVLKDSSWIEAIQEELLQFKMQKVWVLEEDIDYDEVFALVARIKAIRLFLAYVFFMCFMVYQMDVKSAFLYGTIKEEVYVCQPPRFKDPDYPDKVYKVVKALYGLHQAPRAWYETMANYLSENGFQRGKIDQTLFIKKQKGDILLVHVHVDDIIFGSTNKELCKAFKKLMKDKFHMSSMGELTFFLGLQIKQKDDGIFICQDKYVAKILRKFVFTKILMVRIWIDYARASLDRKSTTGGYQFLGCRLISWQCKKHTVVATSSTEAEYVAVASCCAQDVIRRDLRLGDADGVACLPNEEIFAELARMGYEKPPPKLTFYKAFFSAVRQTYSSLKDSKAQEKGKKLEKKKKKSRSSGFKRGNIEAIDADEDITIVDVETQVDIDVELQGRIDQDVSAAIKDVSAAKPTVFDDEEVTVTMAQTLIEMKEEKAKLLDEQITKRKNMIIYLKNISGYKMEHFKGMTYEKVRPIFEREYKKVQTLFNHDKDVEEPKKKRVAEETLLQESFKKQKAVEVSVYRKVNTRKSKKRHRTRPGISY
nr:putative ribonuclease H-like domain-containing protein [Tanacetum cinerariifolium]